MAAVGERCEHLARGLRRPHEAARCVHRTPAARTMASMWLDDMDIGGRGVVLPAKGPLGRALRAARLDLLLSQQQLATSVGASQASVSRLERGAPNWRLFCRLVDAMGGVPVVTIAEIPNRMSLWGRLFADADTAIYADADTYADDPDTYADTDA